MLQYKLPIIIFCMLIAYAVNARCIRLDFKKILANVLAFFKSLGVKIEIAFKRWWNQLNKKKVAAGTAKATALSAYHIVSIAFKAVITVFLILITTCLVFACFFIFYVKTNLTSQLDKAVC